MIKKIDFSLIELQKIEERVIGYICQSYENLSFVYSNLIQHKNNNKKRLCYFKYFIHSELIIKLNEYKKHIEENKLKYDEIKSIILNKEYEYSNEEVEKKEIIPKEKIYKVVSKEASKNILEDLNILKTIALKSFEEESKDLSQNVIIIYPNKDSVFFIYRNNYIDYIRTDNWDLIIPNIISIEFNDTLSHIYENFDKTNIEINYDISEDNRFIKEVFIYINEFNYDRFGDD